jgi:hypothetical protein
MHQGLQVFGSSLQGQRPATDTCLRLTSADMRRPICHQSKCALSDHYCKLRKAPIWVSLGAKWEKFSFDATQGLPR